MKSIVKTFGFIAILAAVSGAYAATSRVSVLNRASPRLPSIAGYITAQNTALTAAGSTLYLSDQDCIDSYTECIKSDEYCGSGMEECTTNVLFHAQMPNCLSALYQCSASGINALFGTNNIGALSGVAEYADTAKTEVKRYTYPTDGSVLGQMVIGAGIANQLNTEQCVKRYTTCLHRDDVCGEDFELCTSQREFKKQALMCDSTLARCQNEGKTQLFGSVTNAAKLAPSGEDVRLVTMIEDGAQLAAMNAVKTCQRVTDNCLVAACANNPWRCVEGISMAKVEAADFVGSATADDTVKTATIVNGTSDATEITSTTGSTIRKLLKAQCLETIGANKYCHMTYREKSPNNKELMDIDLQEDVFSLAYAARKEAVNTKIQEALKTFDTNAKNACVETISSCAMRSCGGGIGSVCYSEARTKSGSSYGTGNNYGIDIAGANTYNEIEAACKPIVNTDSNCQYAATSSDGYEYSFVNKDTFTKVFPQTSNGSNEDLIGAVAYLNGLLATSYNDAAIENMRKQCQASALSCVRSMCGTDYVNCYRNRTDIVAGTYDSGAASFDKSMNKVGGVLDYNIVIGLCLNTIKNNSTCDEHLKIAAAKWRDSSMKDTNSWGSSASVGSAWGGANSTKAEATVNTDVVLGCTTVTDLPACSNITAIETCGYVDEDGCLYDKEQTQSWTDYALDNAGTTLFQELLRDVEKEVQAKYNAKLTKEQNVCLANNNGGIMGASDNGSTFMWVKLKSNKIPNNYAMNGLATKEFTASNDLYGSFCRAKVTIQSDDKDIQNELGADAYAYFAVGDSFTCGSWISEKTLRKISEKVGKRKLCEEGYGQWDADGECNTDMLSTKEKNAYAWATVGGFLGGGALGTGLTEGGLISKWMNKANEANNVTGAKTKTNAEAQKACISNVDKAIELLGKQEPTMKDIANINSYAASASAQCKQISKTESECKYTRLDAENKQAEQTATLVNTNSNVEVTLDVDKFNTYAIAASLSSGTYTYNWTYIQDSGFTWDVTPNGALTITNNKIVVREATGSVTVVYDAGQSGLAYTEDASLVTLGNELADIRTACENPTNAGKDNTKAARIAIPIATAVAGGALGAGITASVIKQKREDLKNTAMSEWMSEVGEHIHCYLGTEELGSYGDIIGIEIN